jgi:FAD/FMN-containing dehydrogenase
MGLRRSDGSHRVLRSGDPEGLFEATIGGLGLTGLITWVELRLQRVPGALLEETRWRLASLDEYFERVPELVPTADHLVAWVDCLARGAALGRGYLSLARPVDGPPASPPKALPAVPIVPPIGLVGRPSLRLFNTALYASTPRRPRTTRVDPYSFFFPLDRIGHWNRLYGPRGFVQYQCVIPKAVAPAGIRALLETIAQSGRGSMLAVLKEFGSAPSPGLLSFPIEGTTLALDFPDPDADLFRLFDAMDAIVAEAGGRLYPAKDARWPGARFRTAYPAWERVEALRDPAFSSSLWRRVCP